MKKVSVYVSSTNKDLAEYRESVSKVIDDLGYEEISKRYADTNESYKLERRLEDVRSSDVYICLLAWRYGHVPVRLENAVGKSITELEYIEARKDNIPRIVFLLRDDVPWPPIYFDSHVLENDNGAKILAFRDKIIKSEMVEHFSSKDELMANASALLRKLSFTESVTPDNDYSATIREYLDNYVLNKTEFVNTNSIFVDILSTQSIQEDSHLVDYKDFNDDKNEIISKDDKLFKNAICSKIECEVNNSHSIVDEVVDSIKKGPSKFALLGQGGSGKTTLLRKITYKLATDFSCYLPIMFNLYNQSQALEKIGLLARISDHLRLPHYEVSELINKGVIIVLLDGFNEIPPVERRKVGSQIGQFLTDFPKSQIIITSRYKINLAGHKETFKERQLQLPNKEKSLELIMKSLSMDSDLSHCEKTIDIWEELYDRLQLSGVTLTPFILKAVAGLPLSGPDLQKSIGLIISAFVRKALKREIQKNESIEDVYEINRKILSIFKQISYLAFLATKENKLSLNYLNVCEMDGECHEAVDCCINTLLLNYEEGLKTNVIKFSHENIRDFFVANYLISNPEKIVELTNIWDKLVKQRNKDIDRLFDFYSDKANVFVLCTDLADNPSRFLRSQPIRSLSPKWREAILLGVRISEAARALAQYCSLDGVDANNLFIRDVELDVRKAAALSLSKINSAESQNALIELSKSDNKITRIFAVVALGKSAETEQVLKRITELVFDKYDRVSHKAIQILYDRERSSLILRYLLDFYFFAVKDINILSETKKCIIYRLECESNDHLLYIRYNKDFHDEVRSICNNTRDNSLRDKGLQVIKSLGPAIDPPELIAKIEEKFFGTFFNTPGFGRIDSKSFSSPVPCLANRRSPLKDNQSVSFTVKPIDGQRWVVQKIFLMTDEREN